MDVPVALLVILSLLLPLTLAAGPMDPWATAALRGDAKEVAKLLRTGGCPDGIDWQDAKYKHSALMVAAEGATGSHMLEPLSRWLALTTSLCGCICMQEGSPSSARHYSSMARRQSSGMPQESRH